MWSGAWLDWAAPAGPAEQADMTPASVCQPLGGQQAQRPQATPSPPTAPAPAASQP